jgi:ATP-dependent helicase YprA (DUF1998 family)
MLTADAGIGIGLTPNISAFFLFIIYASHLHRDAAADSAACYQRNRAMATRRNLKFFFSFVKLKRNKSRRLEVIRGARASHYFIFLGQIKMQISRLLPPHSVHTYVQHGRRGKRETSTMRRS